MRRIGAPLFEAFPDAIVNIHPSLLPSFPGLHAQRQTLAHASVKVKRRHRPSRDRGSRRRSDHPERTVPVLDGDTEESLAARILTEEHVAYPEAVQKSLDGHWIVEVAAGSWRRRKQSRQSKQSGENASLPVRPSTTGRAFPTPPTLPDSAPSATLHRMDPFRGILLAGPGVYDSDRTACARWIRGTGADRLHRASSNGRQSARGLAVAGDGAGAAAALRPARRSASSAAAPGSSATRAARARNAR